MTVMPTQQNGLHHIQLSSPDDSSWDAGLLLLDEPTATPSPVVTGTPPGWYIPPEDYVGPIRSGRLTYNHIKYMFTDSCLVYASAGRGIREALDGCEIIFGVDPTTPNSSLLTIKHMRELADESKVPNHPINYSGNLFSSHSPTRWPACHRHPRFLPRLHTGSLGI